MTKARSYHHPDLRQALLDGAVEAIQSEGMRAFSLRGLAARLGVSHAAPYRHFASKEALVATLLLEGHKRLRLDLIAARDACRGKAADKLLALHRAYLDFARQFPAYLSIMFSREGVAAELSLSHEEVPDLEQYGSFSVLENAVRDCQAEGALDAQADTAALTLLVWAEAHGLALLQTEGVLTAVVESRGKTEAQAFDAMQRIVKARVSGGSKGTRKRS